MLGTQSPSVPTHKGALVACVVPQPGCTSQAPVRKSLRMPSSPRQLQQVTRVSPAPGLSPDGAPAPVAAAPRGPGRTFAAGCLFNELCLPRACEGGFCQRCRTWFSVSSL